MIENHILNETLRYLGAEDGVFDDAFVQLVTRAIDRVEKAAKKQHCIRRIACFVNGNDVCLGTHSTTSLQLANHLQGCDEVFLFAATLGTEVDRLLHRDAVSQPSLAVAEQAAAAALIEQYCDDVCEQLASSLDGLFCRPRFSAGYGDFLLSEQPYILQALDTGRRIGLTCTQAFMLAPTKSVTAVIGISKQPSRCYAKGCDCCSKTDCLFRRKT